MMEARRIIPINSQGAERPQWQLQNKAPTLQDLSTLPQQQHTHSNSSNHECMLTLLWILFSLFLPTHKHWSIRPHTTYRVKLLHLEELLDFTCLCNKFNLQSLNCQSITVRTISDQDLALHNMYMCTFNLQVAERQISLLGMVCSRGIPKVRIPHHVSLVATSSRVTTLD